MAEELADLKHLNEEYENEMKMLRGELEHQQMMNETLRKELDGKPSGDAVEAGAGGDKSAEITALTEENAKLKQDLEEAEKKLEMYKEEQKGGQDEEDDTSNSQTRLINKQKAKMEQLRQQLLQASDTRVLMSKEIESLQRQLREARQ